MKKRQRKQYSADLKAKVALEAIKGQRTIHLKTGNFLSEEWGAPQASAVPDLRFKPRYRGLFLMEKALGGGYHVCPDYAPEVLVQ